jgi:hypothetical protein
MVPIIDFGVKGLDWPFAPWRWPYFAVTVASKVRASGLFNPLFAYQVVGEKRDAALIVAAS